MVGVATRCYAQIRANLAETFQPSPPRSTCHGTTQSNQYLPVKYINKHKPPTERPVRGPLLIAQAVSIMAFLTEPIAHKGDAIDRYFSIRHKPQTPNGLRVGATWR